MLHLAIQVLILTTLCHVHNHDNVKFTSSSQVNQFQHQSADRWTDRQTDTTKRVIIPSPASWLITRVAKSNYYDYIISYYSEITSKSHFGYFKWHCCENYGTHYREKLFNLNSWYRLNKPGFNAKFSFEVNRECLFSVKISFTRLNLVLIFQRRVYLIKPDFNKIKEFFRFNPSKSVNKTLTIHLNLSLI